MKKVWTFVKSLVNPYAASFTQKRDSAKVLTATSETIEVPVVLSGDAIAGVDSPFPFVDQTKKRVYGINVYYKSNKSQYKPYAFGLFDNENDLKIPLVSKYQYKFECAVVQGCLDDLYTLELGGRACYYEPFNPSDWACWSLENVFFDSRKSGTCLPGMKQGYSSVKSGNYYRKLNYPATDRLYGELEGYTPQANDTVVIPMIRTAFGARLVLTPPCSGRAKISSTFCDVELELVGGETTTIESLYTFSKVYKCWQQPEDYVEDFKIELTWYPGDGTKRTSIKMATMKRNTLTTVSLF